MSITYGQNAIAYADPAGDPLGTGTGGPAMSPDDQLGYGTGGPAMPFPTNYGTAVRPSLTGIDGDMYNKSPNPNAPGIAADTTSNSSGTDIPDEAGDPNVGQLTGTESSLSNWVGPYVTDMLGRGRALADTPYEAYYGPLTAGESDLQRQGYAGLAGLVMPENMGAYDPGSFTDTDVQSNYMNPYIQGVLDPQLAELRRQAEISRVEQAGRLTRAGAFGGSRQQLADSELTRNLLDKTTQATGQAYADAFTQGRQQFNTEQDRAMSAQDARNNYGLRVLADQLAGGAQQRGIEAEGIAADKLQFEEERDFPYKQVQYMQSLLQGLPMTAQSRQYSQPSGYMNAAGGVEDIVKFLKDLGLGG